MNRLVLLAAVLASLAACTDPSAVSPRRPSAQAVSAPNPADAIDLGTLGGNSTTPRALNNGGQVVGTSVAADGQAHPFVWEAGTMRELPLLPGTRPGFPDRKSTRLNSSHRCISYAVFCLKKKN